MTEIQRFTAQKTVLGDRPAILTLTGMFRRLNFNDVLLAREVLPQYLHEHPDVSEPLITDVGCSKGWDTWSGASALAAYDVPGRIIGLEINPEAFAETDRPLPFSKEKLQFQQERSGWPPECLDFFEEAGDGYTQPVAALQERVDFRLQNILTEPLEPGHDAVIMNHVLGNYREADDQEAILENVTHGLKRDGVLTACDGYVLAPEVYARYHLEPLDQPRIDGLPVFYRHA